MKIRGALAGFAFITLIYVASLLWIDAQRHVFLGLKTLWPALGVAALLSLLSFTIRYARWQWLLKKAGCGAYSLPGLLAYLAGFAFTATPGKVGELVRIRYFSQQGVESKLTLSAFIYERAMDLMVVLILATFFVADLRIYLMAAGFVVGLILLLSGLIHKPVVLDRLALRLRLVGAKRLSRLIKVLRSGLAGCQRWLNAKDIVASFLLGIVAWGLTSLSFIYLCHQLGIDLPVFEGLSIYPISLLAGAASMIPGGLASTETTIVAILHTYGVDLSLASLAAIGIRLATLWLSMVCGLISIVILEGQRVSSHDYQSDSRK